MKKNRTAIVIAIDVLIALFYWLLLIFSMGDRIRTGYGAFDLFDILVTLRPFILSLLMIVTGAICFFKDELKAWQLLVISIAVSIATEIAGNAAAALVYGRSFSFITDMLETPVLLLISVVLILILWGIVCGIRAISRSVKAKNAASAVDDIEAEYRRERQKIVREQDESGRDRPAVLSGSVNVYKSSGVVFIGYLLRMLLVCVTLTFLAGGAILMLLDVSEPGPILTLMGISAAVCFVIALLRGVMRIEVGNEGFLVRRWTKAVGSYAFADYAMRSQKTLHTFNAIPLYTDRSIVLTDKSGYTHHILCRNFDEKTFQKLVDNITMHQRALQRAEEKAGSAAVHTSFADGPRDTVHMTTEVKYRQPAARSKILPLPGEDDFVSMTFAINKGQMVEAEQKRCRTVFLSLLLFSIAMFAAWYFLLYRNASAPMPNLLLFSGGLIFSVFFIIPTVVMSVRFSQEQKRIPVSIIIESNQFVIDGQPFPRTQIQSFRMTPPGGAKIGTASHRMHISFVYGKKIYRYTIGSGTIKKAAFPDYSLLYKAFDAQRVHAAQGPTAVRQVHRMIETTLKLTPHTIAVIKVPRREELSAIAGIISGNDKAVAARAEEIVNNPYAFSQTLLNEYIRYGANNPSALPADIVGRIGVAILLEKHCYSVMVTEEEQMSGLLNKLQLIIQEHKLLIDLSGFSYSDEDYAAKKLEDVANRLLLQGYRLGDLNVSMDYNLFLIQASNMDKLKELAGKMDWTIHFEFRY